MSFGENMTTATPTAHTDRHAEAAISLVQRYKLMTAAALHELRFDLFPSERFACQCLRRLTSAGVLAEAPLYRNRSYFHRTAPGTSVREFSEESKISAYAMLAVCTSRTNTRTRLTREEFQEYFADTYRPGLPMNYYIDLSASQPVLGFVRVDQGGQGRWDRVVAKALKDARRHRLQPAFARFLKRDALEIRIVTALPQKADRLRRALHEKQAARGIPIHISVVPELINLIAPLPS